MPYTKLPPPPRYIAHVEAKELLEIKRKLWCDVYIAYVGAMNAINEDGAANWADIAVKRFDERFNQEDK